MTASHEIPTVRDSVVRLLREFGITTIFGNPGSTELPLFRHFPDDFRYVLGLQESVVLGMADGFAQATGNAALVNLHSAAGTGHALGNLFTAYRNYTPLIVTAGQQARSILPYEPYLFAERATELPRPYVKWSAEPARAEDVPAAFAHAYYIAMQPPRGPVFLSLPVDDWDRHGSWHEVRKVSRRVLGDPDMLARAGTALASASRPVIVAGAGIARDGAWREVIALSEKHSAPVWVAPVSARAGFPENHANFAGFLSASREDIRNKLSGADVILVLGGPVSRYHIEGDGPHLPEGAQTFIVTDDPAIAAWAPAGDAIISDIKTAAAALLAHSAREGRLPVTAFKRATPAVTSPMTDAYVLSRVAALRPAGSIIVEEAPSSRDAMHDYLPIIDEDSFFVGASGGLGHGLPAAIGVALGRPNRRVIAILGDGSSMYAIQGLWSAGQLGLAITFVVLRNGRYQALVDFDRYFKMDRDIGTSLPNIDLCGLAIAQGLQAFRSETVDDLDLKLKAALTHNDPSLIEVAIE
jgi:benzoylformate decarboxylase